MPLKNNLYYNTVTPLLLDVLKKLMQAKEFDAFRLVGGTALSLQIGHRESEDIDLFSDALYRTLDFDAIETFLRSTYPYVDTNKYSIVGMGKSFRVGENKDKGVKVDLFYTDEFIQEILLIDDIRLASVEEIIAMKVEVISRGGRKKDFWDIHELMKDYTFEQMLALHEKRYPYTHDHALIKKNFTEFKSADENYNPVCLRGKHWEIIKVDMIDFVNES